MRSLLRSTKGWQCGLVICGMAVLVLTGIMIGHRPHDLSNPTNHHHADQIIASFENSTTDIRYDYVENLHDGRGYTLGRAGFTTGTGDALLVVQKYDKQRPNNRLAAYEPALRQVNGSDSTAGLDGFADVWRRAAQDPGFRQAQDQVVDQLYFQPAMRWAAREDIHSALGQLIFYDTIIQHGEGDDPDGMPAMITEALQKYPRHGMTEKQWLEGFLAVRKIHLEHASDPDTRQDWQESVDRVSALRSFLETGNLDLMTPLKWRVYGDDYSI
jgi:chitosanase